MTFSDPPFPLAQSTEFEVGETFKVNARVDEDEICYESNSIFIELRDSDASLIERSYVNVMLTMPASSDMVGNISHDPMIHYIFPLHVHYPLFPLSVIICYLLNIMLCLRGQRLTI